MYLQLAQDVIQRLGSQPGFASLMTGQRYEISGEWQAAALEAYRDAVATLPTVPGIRVACAKLQIARKDWDGARKSLEDEMRLDPGSYEALFHLARAALAQGDAVGALRHLDQAVRIRPGVLPASVHPGH